MTSRTLLTATIALLLLAAGALADDWPQWRGENRDGVWRESGVVEKLPAELRFKWKTPIGGGFSGPAVVGSRVYVTDRTLAEGESTPENKWDKTDPVEGGERVLCLDAASGSILWKHQYGCRYTISYPTGPRATPTVDDGRVYTVGVMGNLTCLDAASGKPIWSKSYVDDFGTKINFWGMAAAPLVEGENLIALVGGSDGACVVALDKTSGAERWRALDSVDSGYSAPVVISAGGTRQLIVWNPVGLYSLNPVTGNVYWHQPFPTKMGHSIATPVFNSAENLVFVTSFFDGPLMMKLASDAPTARPLWQGESHSERPDRTDGLHSVMCTPLVEQGYIYGVCSYGQLRCLEAESGRRIWASIGPTGDGRWWNAFLVKHQDRVFISNEQGELITAELSPEGYKETSRALLIEPTVTAGRRTVVWSHPAFANRCIYARNDKQIVCADLSE